MTIVVYRKTKKRHKVMQLIGVAALLVGVAVRTGTGELLGTAVAIAGLLLFVLGRLLAWWKTG